MRSRILLAVLAAMALVAVPLYAQFPGKGNDTTTSLGSFKIQVAPAFQSAFAGCSGYDSSTHVYKSPTLYDGNTVIGRSDPLLDGSSDDTNGVAVGDAGTTVKESDLFPPTDYPCGNGSVANCSSGTNTREVHTEVYSLKLSSGGVTVRAGQYYNYADTKTDPPTGFNSPGEVESHSGPNGNSSQDFPASSFFDIFVKVDVPACGSFSGGTLFNTDPLLVKNYSLTVFPPKVVYLHDSSNVVPIKIKDANNNDVTIGSIVLAGHGVSFTNSDCDIGQFEDIMSCAESGSSPSIGGGGLQTCVVRECNSTAATGTLKPSSTSGPTGTSKPVVKKH